MWDHFADTRACSMKREGPGVKERTPLSVNPEKRIAMFSSIEKKDRQVGSYAPFKWRAGAERAGNPKVRSEVREKNRFNRNSAGLQSQEGG